MPSVRTSLTELPESRVRLEAEVPAEEVERSVAEAARQLGRQMRVPGFRRGKVPPPIVIRRLGREAVLDEALRKHLGSWYADAIQGAGIAPVGQPELDVSELPGEGEPLSAEQLAYACAQATGPIAKDAAMTAPSPQAAGVLPTFRNMFGGQPGQPDTGGRPRRATTR